MKNYNLVVLIKQNQSLTHIILAGHPWPALML